MDISEAIETEQQCQTEEMLQQHNGWDGKRRTVTQPQTKSELRGRYTVGLET